MTTDDINLRRECLLSTGATAEFPQLIEAALAPACLQALADHHFTHLTLQCGHALPTYQAWVARGAPAPPSLTVRAFDFNRASLTADMQRCQAVAGRVTQGLVICHAGAGTILECLRLQLLVIVVPNATLLDNHQVELAREVQRLGHATMADPAGLADAIRSACRSGDQTREIIPIGARCNFAQIIDEVVGYEDV
ncbi:hypothetical protein K3495_g744 [Podosphaera aphanis]|nr:hypothetical protein K3495_g744 [Podosphaera aphanis]